MSTRSTKKSAHAAAAPTAAKSTTTTKKTTESLEKPQSLLRDIEPGQVLVLLTGQYRGSRVIFLRQLDSGLLLVTGVVSINSLPARRVDQSYVIVTDVNIPLPQETLEIANKFDDSFFQSVCEFSLQQKEQKIQEINQERVNMQKKLEGPLKSAILKHSKEIVSYLTNRADLAQFEFPHLELGQVDQAYQKY
jgi:large subunit ribosomal protein L6e